MQMAGRVNKKIIFVLGGARSGKSSLAMRLARGFDGPRVYLATARALDSEMEERIRRHREERGEEWTTVEEPVDLSGAVSSRGGAGVVLVDCLTLWLSNLLESGLGDGEILREVEAFKSTCTRADAGVVVVSNEVGLSVVPENALARRFRDLSGFANQSIAEVSDEAYFALSGIPVRIK